MFIFPLDDFNARVSSIFSLSRKNPVTGQIMPHYGVDFAVPSGTPVKAIQSGLVITSGKWGTGGLTIRIRHDNGYISEYLHNSKLLVSNGQKVKQGQKIAEVGSTGNSTGPHLHFGIYDSNTKNYINPLQVVKKADTKQASYLTDLLSRVSTGKENNIENRVTAEVERVFKGNEFLYVALGMVAVIASADYVIRRI